MKFEVYKKEKPLEKFPLCGAYMFGTDGISIRRVQIGFKKGIIECKRPNMETAGLALLWPVEDFGRALLPTTCLPERGLPYNLNVEITRAKLMQITNKREDWSFFDNIDGAEELAKDAQQLFIKSIQNISDSAKASLLADHALKKAMLFSEKLALEQAQALFDNRSNNRSFGRGCLGCRLETGRICDGEYIKKILSVSGLVIVPINWAAIEPVKDKFEFSELDQCISYLRGRKVVVGAGPLLCFKHEYLPGWLLNSGLGFEKIRDAAYQFVSRVVNRYAGSVHRWYVVGGLNQFNQFNFNFEQILEVTRAACMAVKTASSRSLVIIDIYSPWGEYYAATPNSIPPHVYMDMVVQSGIHCDAFGIQLHFGKNAHGMHIRDMMQISAMLDTFGPIAKPLHITDVQVPCENGTGIYSGTVAGIWYNKWDHEHQSRWIEQFYTIALSKPFVESVVYGSLIDNEHNEIAGSGLMTEDLEPKESYKSLRKLFKSLYHK